MSKGGSGIFDGTRGNPQRNLPLGGGEGTGGGGPISPHPDAVPGHGSATVPDAKLSDYALNEDHPVGGDKAKVFKAALGFTREDAGELKQQILSRLPYFPAKLGKKDEYGQRYTVDMPIIGKNGKIRTVRTGWIIKPGESSPSLTTAYVL